MPLHGVFIDYKPPKSQNNSMAQKEKLTKPKSVAQENSELGERIFTLEKKRDQLQFLCQNLDPFKPLEESDKKILRQFNLHLIDDPYRLTALLITLMEDTLTELETLKVTNTPKDINSHTTIKN